MIGSFVFLYSLSLGTIRIIKPRNLQEMTLAISSRLFSFFFERRVETVDNVLSFQRFGPFLTNKFSLKSRHYILSYTKYKTFTVDD